MATTPSCLEDKVRRFDVSGSTRSYFKNRKIVRGQASGPLGLRPGGDGVGSEPEEYMGIFRGLRFKPDAEIGPFSVFEMAFNNIQRH